MTRPVSQDAFAIAKALHHINAAKFYFDYFIAAQKLRFEQKEFFRSRVKELDRCLSHIRGAAVSAQTYTAIINELSDPLLVDAFVDAVLTLTVDRRERLSAYLNSLLDEQQSLSSGVIVDTVQVGESAWVCSTNKPFDHTKGTTPEEARGAMRYVLLQAGHRSETVQWKQPKYLDAPPTC